MDKDKQNEENLNPINSQKIQDNDSQDNPYYNPYFQNTDFNNSPYFTDTNVNINFNNNYAEPNNLANTKTSDYITNNDDSINPFELNSNMNFNENTTYNDTDNVNSFNSENNNTDNYYGSDNDESFRKTWMGNLYNKAQNRKFNFSAFFFGGLYYLYRKLYLCGFIITIINIVLPIVIIMQLLNNLSNIESASILTIILSILPIFLNIIYGFVFYPLYRKHVENKLKTYKNEVQNPTQLLNISNNKGGTNSILPILVLLLSGIISSFILSSMLIPIISKIPNMPNKPNVPSNNVNNEITDLPTISYDVYNFYKDYTLKYDSSKWKLNTTDNYLINGNYNLKFIQSLENLSTVGYDLKTETGRSNFFTFLYSQFSSQINTNTTLELGSSNFAKVNDLYFAYLDLVYETSMERCYFILIPEQDIFLELVLSNQDTVISDEVHNEVYEYVTSIEQKNASNNTNEDLENLNNTITNDITQNIVNNVSTNTPSENVAQPSEIVLY